MGTPDWVQESTWLCNNFSFASPPPPLVLTANAVTMGSVFCLLRNIPRAPACFQPLASSSKYLWSESVSKHSRSCRHWLPLAPLCWRSLLSSGVAFVAVCLQMEVSLPVKKRLCAVVDTQLLFGSGPSPMLLCVRRAPQPLTCMST